MSLDTVHVGSDAPGRDPIDVFDPDALRDPRPLYARLRTEEPVHRVPGSNTYLVSTWDLVQEAVLLTEHLSSNMHSILLRRPDGTVELDMWANGAVEQVLAIADEPVHRLHRKVVLNALNRRIRGLDPLVRAICEELWTTVVDGDRVDWAGGFADLLPIRVIAELIGLPADDVPEILELTYSTTELLGGVVPEERASSVLAAPLQLWSYLEKQFERALSSPRDDLAGALATACRTGEIQAGTAVAILMQVINAGGESTASLIGNAARVLAEHPDLVPVLRADKGALDRFLDEVLRIDGPFRGHYRHAVTDVALGDAVIPAGSTVLLLWGAANLDPHHYPRPDVVDLDRPGPRQHLGFGRGVHFCVGSALARLEATAALELLLSRTDGIRLDPADPPQRVQSLTMSRHHRLPLLLASSS